MADDLDRHIAFNNIFPNLEPDEWNILDTEKRNATDGKVVLDMQSEHGKILRKLNTALTGHENTYISPQKMRGGVSTGILLMTEAGEFVLCDTPQPEINPDNRAIRKPGGFVHMDIFLPFVSETLQRCADKLGGWTPVISRIPLEYWHRPYSVRKEPYDMKYEKNCWGLIQFVPYWMTDAELEDLQNICAKLENPVGIHVYSLEHLNNLYKADMASPNSPKNLSLDEEISLLNTMVENGWNLPPVGKLINASLQE